MRKTLSIATLLFLIASGCSSLTPTPYQRTAQFARQYVWLPLAKTDPSQETEDERQRSDRELTRCVDKFDVSLEQSKEQSRRVPNDYEVPTREERLIDLVQCMFSKGLHPVWNGIVITS